MCVHSIYLKQINVRVGTCKCIAAWCVRDDRSLSRTTKLTMRDPCTLICVSMDIQWREIEEQCKGFE